MVEVIASAKVSAAVTDPSVDGISITHGLTLANDDILYAILGQGDDLGTGWASSSGGTWVELIEQQQASGEDLAAGVMRRVVTNAAGEPSSYLFTRPGSTAAATLVVIVVQVRAGSTSTPEDVTPTAAVGIDDFTPDHVDITTTTAGCLLLIYHLASSATAIDGTKTPGAPSGFTLTDHQFSVLGPGRDFLVEVAHAVAASSGAQSIGAWTGTPDDAILEWGVGTVAVRPASSPASYEQTKYRLYADDGTGLGESP